MSADRRAPYKPFDRSLNRGFLGASEIVSVELFPADKSNTSCALTVRSGSSKIVGKQC